MFALDFPALYVLLRKRDDGLMAIALIFVLLGTGIFLTTNNPFSMLTLSQQHAAATTDAERSTLLAAGQTLLINTKCRVPGDLVHASRAQAVPFRAEPCLISRDSQVK